MLARVAKQDEVIRDAQEQVALLNTNVNNLCEEIIGYQQEMQEIRKNSYTAEQVKQLIRRNQELEYICGALYDKVYELINTGTVTDPTLPDFNDPYLPGDPVLTEEELEAEWREKNGIDPDAELTEEQKESLQYYIDKYYETHPRPEDQETP